MLRIENTTLINKTKSSSFRGALIGSGVMAFAGLGDAILYPLLPVYGKDMGFSVFFIGVLLSINRFVRILSNTWIATIIIRLGMRKVLIITSILATITTFFYGLKLGAISFLIARILWGLSYSGLKISTLNYAANAKEKSGLAFGLSKSIQTLGTFFVLWFGPVLIAQLGVGNGLITVAFVSSMGIGLAIFLPKNEKKQTEKVRTSKTFYPSTLNLLVFVLSIAIDGILVVVLAQLLGNSYSEPGGLLAVVAFYLLLKRLFVFSISFLGAYISLKISPKVLFNVSVVLCAMALFLIAMGFVTFGILLAFVFNPIIVTFSPMVAMQQEQTKGNTLQAISSISTWWDFGAALGAFMGLFLIETMSSEPLFLLLSVFIIILFINHIFKNARTNRTAV
ncbi:MFS transporter [Flagellimonas sp.]|uniref:MFS transporter n=1 Tax=Flagellimonas sp. TaxID=2058762 RepID=UPI003B5BB1B5